MNFKFFNKEAFAQRLWMPRPWKRLRPGWMGPCAIWSSERCLLLTPLLLYTEWNHTEYDAFL